MGDRGVADDAVCATANSQSLGNDLAAPENNVAAGLARHGLSFFSAAWYHVLAAGACAGMSRTALAGPPPVTVARAPG